MAAKTAVAVKKQPRELTEEEILKAPEKDYMNEAQLAFFKKRLDECATRSCSNADDTGEHLRENEITTDPSDRATLEEEYTLELRTRDRERKLLKKVEKSLRMIDDGSLRLLRGNGRADRRAAAPRASDGDACRSRRRSAASACRSSTATDSPRKHGLARPGGRRLNRGTRPPCAPPFHSSIRRSTTPCSRCRRFRTPRTRSTR